MSTERIDNMSHWTVEYTTPAKVSNGQQTWAQNGSTEVVAGNIHRAIAMFTAEYPEAVIHVVRKTSRFRSILIDRSDPNLPAS